MIHLKVLALHSLVRWFLLAGLLLSCYRAYRGWHAGRTFGRFDNSLRHTTATIAHIQLMLGLWLYFISPTVDYFLHNIREGIHERQIRFFGMEHITMMLIAVIFITIGSAKAKRKTDDTGKYKTMAIWYTIALVIIISSIPWPFSPLISRPWLRPF